MSNPLAEFTTSNSMVEDLISLPPTYVPGFLAGCVDLDVDISDRALQGLPKRTRGIVGFSRSKLSFPSQLVLANKLLPIFSLCFPSSNNLKGYGKIFIGAAAGGHSQVESKFLQTTALVVNPVATTAVSIYGAPSIEYFIDVRSIKIDGHVVNLNPSLPSIDKKGNGGTKISSVTPWTELHSSLYKPFVQDFVNKAAGRRMKRVASVAPFDACFDSSTIENSVTGLVVPVIDLVLAGGVQWSIHGANSMVMAGKNVACLAFVDGGMKPKMSSVETSIVIGGHQLEDNLLVFDEASSRLSFSSSLLLRNTTCSHV
ncbi:gamma conglutin 2-like isoform X2 [Vigna unguiculata]|nr:gamma conglutin 2-like isoform X2 [Vigna unguiculata]